MNDPRDILAMVVHARKKPKFYLQHLWGRSKKDDKEQVFIWVNRYGNPKQIQLNFGTKRERAEFLRTIGVKKSQIARFDKHHPLWKIYEQRTR